MALRGTPNVDCLDNVWYNFIWKKRSDAWAPYAHIRKEDFTKKIRR